MALSCWDAPGVVVDGRWLIVDVDVDLIWLRRGKDP